MTSFTSPDNYELGLITKDITNKTTPITYYAKAVGTVIKIYMNPPTASAPAPAQSLFEIVNDTITSYEMSIDQTPDDAVPFYVITENIGSHYQINDNPPMYVLPSLTPGQIETKVAENKAAVDAKRLADEAEVKRLADEAEVKRLADEAEVKRLADEAETKRLADEAEVKRLADEAETKRLADEAEVKRLADEAEKNALQAPTTPPHSSTALPPAPPLYKINADGTPDIKHFTGGSDQTISNELKALYTKNRWSANELDPNNEFIYIEHTNTRQIIAAVRINNSKKELDYDYIDTDFQRQKLYDPLLKARLKFILENKQEMYVLYTEFEYLKKNHIKNGMTLISETQVKAPGDSKLYWKFEYNRNPRTLVTTTKFSEGGMCSGIAIGNNGIQEYIYTATHCLKTPGVQDKLPTNVLYSNIGTTEIKTEFVRKDNIISYQIPVTQNQKENEKKYFIEIADDIAVFNTTPLLDTTNIFLINNCEAIPKDSVLDYWGALSTWSKSTLIDDNDVITNLVNTESFPDSDFDTVYPDWKIETENDIIYDYQKYFRLIQNTPSSGNSGGPHGFFFNRTTGKIDSSGLCFAVCFTTGSAINVSDGSINIGYGVVISASRWITWLKNLGVKINIAQYNDSNKTITIVQ
jgi:hypothetical protein